LEKTVFLKFRVKAAIAKFLTMHGLHAETLTLLEQGTIDYYMPFIESERFDANQGAVTIITGGITNAAKNGALMQAKSQLPHIYSDLTVLWRFCCALRAEDEQRWGEAFVLGNIDGDPFEYAERDFCIQKAIDQYAKRPA
jgi:hypothetical protein